MMIMDGYPLNLRFICVGRVLFNPPPNTRWRVKENPPYAIGATAMHAVGMRSIQCAIVAQPILD